MISGDNTVLPESGTGLEVPSANGNGIEKKQTQGNVFGELDFVPNFQALSKSRTSATLSWEKVSLAIKGKKILQEVSGKVHYNEVCALLGPSGAGKSSLLNTLAARISNSKEKSISGNVLVNGQVVSPVEFRRNIAYVMQEDALFATATAREALEFSAKLRLPRSVTDSERGTIVDELLKSLGLEHVQNTVCGSELVRGLSGGEKKRVSIGVELVTNPQILFLDEPTSGLDSFSAYQVVCILKALSRSGCAVLCTIHQPSSEIFSVFDKTLVLAKGRVIYNGTVSKMPEKLDSLGFTLPPLTNPADFIMVLAQTRTYDQLPHYNEDEDPANAADSRAASNLASGTGFDRVLVASPMTQLALLSQREFRNLGRDKGALIGRFGITIFLNLLFGWIFFGAADLNASNYLLQSHFGALTNAFISALFGASQPPLLTFPLERVVFLREYSTGSYSSAPYFFSKLMVELPLYFVTAMVINLILYWLVGFNAPFIILVLEIFLLQIVSASYAFVIGAMVNNVKQAQELAPLAFVPQLLFTGFFIRLEQIPPSIRWVQYLCSLKFGLSLGMISEFGGEVCKGDGPKGNLQVEECHRLLDSNDVDEDLAWLYVVILLAIFVVFRIGSLAILVWRAKNYTN